jgi:hypothetical protein
MSRTNQLPGSVQEQTANPDFRQTLAKPLSRYARDAGVLGVRGVDLLLRCCFGIKEFSKRSDCILRVSVESSPLKITLQDATVIECGDPILELHFWNEHLIHCLSSYELFGWGFCLQRRIRLSLMLLADRVPVDDDLADFEAVHASLTISLDRAERVFRRLGFTISYPRRSVLQQVHDFFESFLICSLTWAFHPYGVRKGKRAPRRAELWLSRSDFERIYGRPVHDTD